MNKNSPRRDHARDLIAASFNTHLLVFGIIVELLGARPHAFSLDGARKMFDPFAFGRENSETLSITVTTEAHQAA